MTKMIPERKALLIEALESGRYEKGVGRLRRGNTFCCLGVACDISGLGEWVGENRGQPLYSTGNDESGVGLTDAVGEWLFGEDADKAGGFGKFDKQKSFLGRDGDAMTATDIATINDSSDSFAPVIAAIKEFF